MLAWTGLPQLLLIPLVPRLMRRFDARWVIAIDFALFAGSNFLNAHMSADTAADQLFWPNVVRALGQALVLTPLSSVATAGIEPENAASVSALFNMTRNLGGAIGIAALQTFEQKREQFHSNVIGQGVSMFAEAARDRIALLTRYFMSHGFGEALARHKAAAAIGARIRGQANVLAFSDTFILLGVALLIALLLASALRRAASLGTAAAH